MNLPPQLAVETSADAEHDEDQDDRDLDDDDHVVDPRRLLDADDQQRRDQRRR